MLPICEVQKCHVLAQHANCYAKKLIKSQNYYHNVDSCAKTFCGKNASIHKLNPLLFGPKMVSSSDIAEGA
jgi:hypothetical protein